MSIEISVVMPVYNAAGWLPLSIPKVDDALAAAELEAAEIVVVDDGSTDGTGDAARQVATRYPLRVVSQANGGRFLARTRGTEAATYDYVLFLDSRVFIDRHALAYVLSRLCMKSGALVWVGHVNIHKSTLYARFWDAVAVIAWRRYFSDPRECSFGLHDFDHYPKGMGCFFVPRRVIKEANSWFLASTTDYRIANDDTRLIRYIARTHRINISPSFSCTYHARGSLRQYVTHVYHRGKVFVDAFLRRDGNRFFWPLVGFLVVSASLPLALALFPQSVLAILFVLVGLWIAALVLPLILKIPPKDALSLFLLCPVFVVVYGLGIWAAVVRRLGDSRGVGKRASILGARESPTQEDRQRSDS
jgi:glycosyltransferase involved in cell wall biosynthesis